VNAPADFIIEWFRQSHNALFSETMSREAAEFRWYFFLIYHIFFTYSFLGRLRLEFLPSAE
jgi:hypothetical protein